MPYGTGSYGSLPYGGDFDSQAPAPSGNNDNAGAWWFTGIGARTLDDAGFLLLVAPHFDDNGDPSLGGDG